VKQLSQNTTDYRPFWSCCTTLVKCEPPGSGGRVGNIKGITSHAVCAACGFWRGMISPLYLPGFIVEHVIDTARNSPPSQCACTGGCGMGLQSTETRSQRGAISHRGRLCGVPHHSNACETRLWRRDRAGLRREPCLTIPGLGVRFFRQTII
jgi:hypothetical protein